MISVYLTKEKTIKNNILAAETAYTGNEISVSLRTIRIGINEMQVLDNFSDKE
jgi:hypothetical protein